MSHFKSVSPKHRRGDLILEMADYLKNQGFIVVPKDQWASMTKNTAPSINLYKLFAEYLLE
jgi:hypothetical protein